MEEISGIKHPEYKRALSLIREGERRQSGQYLVETTNFVRQALASPAGVSGVFALAKEAQVLRSACAERGVPLYVLSQGLLNKLVGTGYDTAVTAVAIVEQTVLKPEHLHLHEEMLLLACENIQDPRNVGVLIRTAEAAGCASILLSADSADPFSRAAVRSSTGSVLRLPVCLVDDLPMTLRQLGSENAVVVASSARAPASVYETGLVSRPLIIVVGNETNGLTPNCRSAASAYVSVPMASNGPSSLNVTVAAGVLLFEAIRQGRSQRQPR
jgi:TrmH family RNA methyltransferase